MRQGRGLSGATTQLVEGRRGLWEKQRGSAGFLVELAARKSSSGSCQSPLTRRPEGAEKSGEGGGGRRLGSPSWDLLGSKCYKVNLASLPFSSTNTRERCRDIPSPLPYCPSPLPSFLSPPLSPLPEPQGVLGPTEEGVASPQDPPADLLWGHLHPGAAGAEGAGEDEP